MLTANRRQARFLQARYAEAMREQGRSVWPTPGILPLDAWLAAKFHEVRAIGRAPAGRLLDDEAAQWVWRDAVAAEVAETLQDPAAVALRARRAWLCLRLHGGDSAALAAAARTGDQLLLLRWMRRAEARLAELDALDCGLLRLHAPALLRVAPPPGVLLCGLDGSSAGLGAVAAAGACWRPLPAPHWTEGVRPVQTHAPCDPDSELEDAIDWLLERLSHSAEGHFGIIVPDLGTRHADVERRLTSVLQPSAELSGSPDESRVFDMAGGPPLAAHGAIAVALDLLDGGNGAVPFAVLTRLLRSRFIAGGDVEQGARARFDCSLREQPPAGATAAQLASRARRFGCPLFAELLERQAQPPPQSEPAPLHEHARRIVAVLEAWGWPGPGPMSSDVYQAVQEWHGRLRTLAAAGTLAGPVTTRAALRELRRLCQAPFQPERGPPRLLVLDALEDVGVPLDGLRVLGLSAEGWPRAAIPDPLLPIGLQRALGIAAALPSGQLSEARRVQVAWQRCARELVLSWPRQRDDARQLPSPLLPPVIPVAAGTRRPRRAELQ